MFWLLCLFWFSLFLVSFVIVVVVHVTDYIVIAVLVLVIIVGLRKLTPKFGKLGSIKPEILL